MDPLLQEYANRLGEIRKQVREAIQGLDQEELNWAPLGKDTSSVAVLVHHMAGVERYWICQTIGSQEIGRNRPAEFAARASSPHQLEPLLVRAARDSEQTLAPLTAQQLLDVHDVRGTPRTVQWCLLYAIEHLASHLGHLQLTRQLAEAQRTSAPKGQ
jgi:uncharacterized damage-inducible protein DinB